MTFIVDCPMRLDRFLANQLPEISRTRLAECIRSGSVSVDGRERKPSFLLEEGMLVEISALPEDRPMHDLTPADIPLDVRFEDDHLMVVNKPRGLAVHPARSLKQPSLVNALIGRAQGLSTGSEDFRPGIVHRLDKETTGLIVVAKKDRAHAALARDFATKSVDRRYVAAVQGAIERTRFTIDAPIGRDPKHRQRMSVIAAGKSAVTEAVRIHSTEGMSVLCLRLSTGRTHQIRVHLEAIGHPVIGDAVYARGSAAQGALQLHSGYLLFKHPMSDEVIEIECEPPVDFVKFPYESEIIRAAFGPIA